MDESTLQPSAPVAPKTITLGRQSLVCAAACVVAMVVVVVFFPKPSIAGLFAGLPLAWQAAMGAAIGAGFALVTLSGLRRASGSAATQRVAGNYGRLDLRGWNPLWFSLLAGFGEELLFRGALQPLLGLWIASLLFVLAHARAYRFRTFDRTTLAQAGGLFATSVVLGLVARFAGLLAAMIVHAAIDTAGLLAIRRIVRTGRAAACEAHV